MRDLFYLGLAALVLLAGCASEENVADKPMDTGDMAHNSTDDKPSTQMHMAMVQMSDDMGKMKMTGDIDKDFAAMMIIHHQGAIDTAELQVKHGKDAELKAMAQEMIDMQKAEQVKLREHIDSR